jgi:hypothetical protein
MIQNNVIICFHDRNVKDYMGHGTCKRGGCLVQRHVLALKNCWEGQRGRTRLLWNCRSYSRELYWRMSAAQAFLRQYTSYQPLHPITVGKCWFVFNNLRTMTWKLMKECTYRSMSSWPRPLLEVSGELHAPAAFIPGKESPVPIR